MSPHLSSLAESDSTRIVHGADVIMTTSQGEITLHAPGQFGRHIIGRFTSPADAWAALDQIDAPDELGADSRAA